MAVDRVSLELRKVLQDGHRPLDVSTELGWGYRDVLPEYEVLSTLVGLLGVEYAHLSREDALRDVCSDLVPMLEAFLETGTWDSRRVVQPLCSRWPVSQSLDIINALDGKRREVPACRVDQLASRLRPIAVDLLVERLDGLLGEWKQLGHYESVKAHKEARSARLKADRRRDRAKPPYRPPGRV